MALIDLQNISKHYSAQKILTEVNFHIDEGERIVVIGKNGSGKSTLMKIIDGSLDADGGRRITKNDLEIKMLQQRPSFEEGHSVREAVEAGLSELNSAKKRYNEIYKIENCYSPKHYDIIIDTTGLSEKQVLKETLKEI
ncbi:MAG: ATP-binding cassette domain-containing protein, partial [Campylobacterota bacterium]|nr:ATP-binding cassette domain-containing protein [Campylobacterota bacterium]